ncbi:hypothetical protein [Clostridium lacusfryxellense]|uniref:hypothetical protein n=1 Tax=Clostridium lacusfryxellense TaxID=205328 RepID=UPI001C0C3DF8|nr:hypothetical protein [Clostridium lacusfryxellense]MBU3114619.1 hypothetical protein [Clostridium lacusfryxellense]
MKMRYELINTMNEQLDFYRSAFSKNDFTKFMDLLGDVNIGLVDQANTIHKGLIEDTLVRQRKRLKRLFKDTTNLSKNLYTIVSISDSVEQLLMRFNEFVSIEEICRIFNVNDEQLLRGVEDYMIHYENGDEYDKEKKYHHMLEHLIFDYGLENKSENVFYIAFHMYDDISMMMNKKVSSLT